MARNLTVNQSHFASLPTANISRSVFDRSYIYKTSFDEGKLIPYFWDWIVPGDTMNLRPTEFCRLSTPVVPVMDNLWFETFFFFVPARLLFDHFVNMCGEQDNPEDSTDYVLPKYTFTANESIIGTQADYLGLGSAHFGSSNGETITVKNNLPFRAVWAIWNEWFRDENLQKSVKVSKGDTDTILEPMGVGTANPNYGYPEGCSDPLDCPPRGKRYDYITGSLPWPQKGEAVNLPLGEVAPVIYGDPVSTGSRFSTGNFPASHIGQPVSVINSSTANLAVGVGGSESMPVLLADLSSATAATINSLRQAFMLQRYYEIDATGGTRYEEKILAHFGVNNPDSRLQKPEFLGSHSSMFNINPIAQTSSTDSTTPQGNLAAMGVLGQTYHAFTKSFTEFGVIIGFCNVRADLTYQQGIFKPWMYSDVLDLYWPSFAHLGEQQVKNYEVYAQGTSIDEDVFGYQERYSELRYRPSQITGKLRSTVSGSLDVWHLSERFVNLPTLSDEFMQDHPPVSRVVAVPSEPHFILDVKFNYRCVRPLPMFGTPGLMGHF